MSQTSKQGVIAVAKFIGEFTSRGVHVSLPIDDSLPYDMIIDCGSLKRIQVKSASRSTESLMVKLQRTHTISGRNIYKNYTAADFDLLAVYDSTRDGFYLLPAIVWDNKGAIKLWYDPPKQKNSFYLKDYDMDVALRPYIQEY